MHPTPNTHLRGLQPLVGAWRTTGTHPMLPGRTFHGRADFQRIEGGAFLAMRTEMGGEEVPAGVAIFGSDDGLGTTHMLYFDARGVSRRYDVEIRADGVTWWRDDPAFRQRFAITFGADGRTMQGVGEMSRDGGPWEGDLRIAYARTEQP